MTRNNLKSKVEYGDFQTPLELSEMVCQKLITLGINPDVIIEPTCGVGNFIEAAAHSFKLTSKIIGLEINSDYLQEIEKKQQILQDRRIEVSEGNFFRFDWHSLVNNLDGKILVLGNFPWITNSRQGAMGGVNLPEKNNFQKHNGLDAMTGKSNFDISEWMLIQVVHWLQNRDASLAMLCKTSVSRKILNYLYAKKLNLAYCATYKIDTKKYFDASVEAGLLFCKFDLSSKRYFCDVFSDLKTSNYLQIGYRNNILVGDIDSFEKLEKLYDINSQTKWRSGVKHDCSNVMEFYRSGDTFINGLGEVVNIEDIYLFPLLKGSDIAQNRTQTTERFVLVTQRFVGEPTESIKSFAPQTWSYLEAHAKYLDIRKSKIYHNKPRFSIFGIGSYTFAPWKIAICGLYKKLDFRLIGKINDRPVIFDDTVYFLSFDDRISASETFQLLTSLSAISFYSSLIFWDEKRPIKSSILNSLNLKALKLALPKPSVSP
ncbi:class I SAM-dependent methyltransferase [Kamptonema sp. UHCC 0994]|uniref:class I SAM-dependent methyltransferase n=1 Tax=Kamptonema sp. UHCC 0994 TaxID=3031329 RepID=UPI0023B90CAA|nr:class I SAM-dependent methyltransferase [Kamptonema sp. UHCC 0994]MDF0554358.1 class I SAM-dependent methyltransferase [Kamptonema sp. UHCC 0994]